MKRIFHELRGLWFRLAAERAFDRVAKCVLRNQHQAADIHRAQCDRLIDRWFDERAKSRT